MVAADLRMIVATMRRAQLAAGVPDAALRRDRLERVAQLLDEHHRPLAAAAAADRGLETVAATHAPDLVSAHANLSRAAREVESWMARRPGSDYWPQGVVGIIAPWTYPVSLALAPLAGVFAAGNVALIKLSPYAQRSSDLLADLVGRYFSPAELGVVQGDDSVGACFAELPFAHLVFTGSARAARSVAANAAARLTPITYAVGGKSPAIVAADADLDRAARFVMTAKLRHAGQCCHTVDHVMVAREVAEPFVEAARAHAADIFANAPAFPAIVNRTHYDRLQSLLADAQNRGARRVPLDPTATVPEKASGKRGAAGRGGPHRMAPELLLDADESMAIMAEEVFGPVLPVVTVADDMDAIGRIAVGPLPAQAIYFGSDPAARTLFADRVAADVVFINPAPESFDGAAMAGSLMPGNEQWSGETGFRRFSVARRLVIADDPSQSSLAATRLG